LPCYVPSMLREHEVAKDEAPRPRKWRAGRVYLDKTDKNILHNDHVRTGQAALNGDERQARPPTNALGRGLPEAARRAVRALALRRRNGFDPSVVRKSVS
jgi:hypothetical protein